MDAAECADRLNVLAWRLDELANQIDGNWDTTAKRWIENGDMLDVTEYIVTVMQEADLLDVADGVELNLESGPERRRRLNKRLNDLYRDARKIEEKTFFGDPDPFRWGRESIDAAATGLTGDLRRCAEYLWGLYFKLGGTEDGAATEQPIRDPVTDARDKWIYDQCCKFIPYKTIVSKLRDKNKNWPAIDSINGVKDAASKYAKRQKLAEIPKRKRGRPSRK